MRNLLLGCIVLAVATSASADVFSYRDKDGKVHFVDQETAIPQQYRTPNSSTSGGDPSAGRPPASGVLNAMPQSAVAPPGADGSDPGIGSPEPAGGGMISCTLRYVEKPAKAIDLRYTRVTYTGEMENTGTGIARTARAHLKLFSAIDGSQIDEQSELLRPGDIEPGGKARFEIEGNFRKAGLRNSSRDELMIDYVRCDPSSAGPASATAGQGCVLQLVGEPQKEIDSIRKTVTYSGSVQNHGKRVAKTVQVELTSFNIRDGKPFPPVIVSTNPPRVGPGDSADFSLVAPLEFGFRDPNKDKFSVRASRCDPIGSEAE